MVLIPMLPPTFDAALRDVSSHKRDARHAAAERLSSPPPGREDEAAAALATLADDTDATVRMRALLALGEVDGGGHLDLVLARFEDGVPGVREAAVITAGRLGGDGAEDALRDALESTFPEVRYQAVMSLAELVPAEAIEAVQGMLTDEDPAVRAHAAEALGKIDDDSVAPALLGLLADDDKRPRREAAFALANLGDARGAEVLREALGDEDTAIAAAIALGELRVEAARDELAAIAGRFLLSPMMRAAVGGALCRLDDPRGIDALKGALTALRADGRGLALESIAALELVELVPEVAALSRRPRGADPAAVADTLATLARTNAGARHALERMAEGAVDDECAIAARKALEG